MADYEFKDDWSNGNASYDERKKLAQEYTQTVADEKGVPSTGSFKFGSGEYYTYTAYPSTKAQSKPKEPDKPSSGTVYSQDTVAYIQRGTLQQPGHYGCQELSESNESFNTAVDIASAAIGFAKLLKKNVKPPANYIRTSKNYILTAQEKAIIDRTAREQASLGVVPFDTLENFLYILAATENLNDLVHISDVVGIPDMGRDIYVRNITGICNLKDIFKIGYLAQGVASVNQQYASQYTNAAQIADISQSYYNKINNSLNISSELGVMGPLILSAATNIAGGGNFLASAPSLNLNSINKAVGIASSALSSVDSLANIGGLLNPQSAIGNIAGGLAGGLGGLADGLAGGIGGALGNVTGQLGAGVQGALGGLLGASPLGGVLSQFGALGGVVAAIQLSQTGGFAIGSFMSEVLTGTRIKTAQIANNPMLQPPSYAGKSFFGEAPVALPAIDQVFCKSIGAFGTSSGGGGSSSFGFQNFASMGGGLSVQSLVSKMVTGSFDIPDPTSFFGSQIKDTISNVSNVLNVNPLSMIEPRRSDNSIPFMVGLSASIVGEKFSPFGSKPFTAGWKLASSAANDIQKHNPLYLETCRTSL